jgi:integrase
MITRPTDPPVKLKAAPNRIKFTQLTCERLPVPTEGHTISWDTNLPGFGIRVASTGRRTWITMYKIRGKAVMESIGSMALIPSVAAARERARASMDRARSGVNPVKERKQQEAAEQKAAIEKAYKLEQLIEDFVRRHHHSSRPSTVREARRLCRRALPWLGDKPVKEISKADILATINDLAQTRRNVWRGNTGPALGEASGVLKHLRSCFRWALDADLVDKDPTAGIRDPRGKKGERDRVLDETEIKALWQVAEELSFPFGPIVQLMLLTTAREKEVGDLPWRELGDLQKRIWALPGERTKNHRALDIHLSDLALEIISKIPRFTGDSGFVFSVDGTKPVSSYSDAKQRIDTAGRDPARHGELDISRFAAQRLQPHGTAGCHAAHCRCDTEPQKRLDHRRRRSLQPVRLSRRAQGGIGSVGRACREIGRRQCRRAASALRGHNALLPRLLQAKPGWRV